MRQGTRYTFREFVLDVDNACLYKENEQWPLRSKVFDLLHYLAERPEQLITKEELFRTLWPNIVVDGATLTGCIRELRAVLNDDAKQPRFIETIPTRGYRFIGKVVGSQPSGSKREKGKPTATGKRQGANGRVVCLAPHPPPPLGGEGTQERPLHANANRCNDLRE